MFNPVIIIPCFNHSDAFARHAKQIAEYKIPVIVVDDGSYDFQSQKLKQICATHAYTYIKHDKNSGKGAAVATGIRTAIKMGFSHAIQIDADGQHDIGDIAKFTNIAKHNPDALIIGQPIYDASAPKSRLIGRKITNFWVAIETLNRHMPDAMCGFRVYPVKTTNRILSSVHFMRMGFDIEILVKLYRMGIKIVTTPTRVKYPETGVSHFHVWRDNFYISLLHTYLCAGLPWWILKKSVKKIGNLFILCAFLTGAANAAPVTEMPETLKTFADNLQTVSASYTQSKTLPESTKTFRANGTVKFVRGVGFKWHQIHPNNFYFTSNLGSYCVNGATESLSELPYFSQIQSTINDLLNGDMEMFLTAFDADYTESKNNWRLTATPKIDAIGEFLKQITMAGNIHDLRQIIIKYTNGTKIIIDFKRMKTDLSDEIKC